MLTERPIPGQSLTTPSKSQSYENPPEIVNPLDALDYTVNRLNSKESMEDAFDLLEMVDLVTITEGILRQNVMQGLHSVDVSILIAPHIHEFIKGEADALGIEYDEGFEDAKAEEELDNSRLGGKALRLAMKEKLNDYDNLEQAIPTEELQPITEESQPMEGELQPMDEEPQDNLSTEVGARGLMAREV